MFAISLPSSYKQTIENYPEAGHELFPSNPLKKTVHHSQSLVNKPTMNDEYT
jgi:hypothetical protein